MIKILEENRKFSFIFLAIIALEIFLLSSIPGSERQIQSRINFSKLYHFASFFLLNFFMLITVMGKEKATNKKLILVFIVSLIYAVLDEMHQFFVPLRNPSINDFLIDSAGILLSTLIYVYYSSRKRFNQ